MQSYVFDRREGEFALLQREGEVKRVPFSLMPENIKEGDVLAFDGECYSPDICETERRRQRGEELLKRLLQRN